MSSHILVVDDDRDFRELVTRQLEELGHIVYPVGNAVDALDMIKGNALDLLITDLQMPGVPGMQLVKYVSEKYPDIPVLVATGFPSVKGAVEAVQSGAVDYLVKPFTKDELSAAIGKSLANTPTPQVTPTIDKKQQVDQSQSSATFHGIIGNSEAIKRMIEMISRINNTNVTVLVNGESGTGKELVARAIHYSSHNAKSPFVAVNCGGIPENLLESELFGYTKGAFTGAESNRAGFFQAAEGGTIFLDEIGNASQAVQQRLLRVLQEKEVTMIGSQKPQKIDVRVVAATNSDLYSMVEKGTFREDLYYRLNVINLHIPPLRDRTDDVRLLAEFFLNKFSKEFDVQRPQMDDAVWPILNTYSWPGNVRELENTIQRLVILADGIILPDHLPPHFRQSSPSPTRHPLRSLEEVEREHILRVLEATDNNKTKAAEILGITRKTLRQKLS
ncbi:sigma-54-dependent transcriptional regulator [Phaeocystidibacter marisrubri]|uniref:Sigma-54-dependent Fis family transcriptional regulator n=1 Tax=Phaeocystidibacter marisrubri TaxID=1577780 RepID=A0A6L3ZE15_9FLAO|nr:sigma-54 dependent transcriptional regulator [Phaeocystidibacter marisrubri]KAB2815632.1 sigma-54-dependent Fis family transcriptional regulator [Phaeocystidibacter marisrubri]GGH64899.1 acetoacetate metabolism regulatory protein AtoC [Phaeocystidibacter marisrubri]